jgi:hypothetical protein
VITGRDFTAAREAARHLRAQGHDSAFIARALAVDVRTCQKWRRMDVVAADRIRAATRAVAMARAGA